MIHIIFALLLGTVTFAFGGSWNIPLAANKVSNPVPKNEETVAKGQIIYNKHCVRCHGLSGGGDGTDQKVEYGLSTIMPELTDGALFWKLTVGAGKMPSVARELTETERWLVINYLRTFNDDQKVESR